MFPTIYIHSVEDRVYLENKARGQGAICLIAIGNLHKIV
jgi:hypothetical protein